MNGGDRIVVFDSSHLGSVGTLQRMFPGGQVSQLPVPAPHLVYVYRAVS